jgi:hypothetical protein
LRSSIPANIFDPWGAEEMGSKEMTEWKSEKEHVMRRMDQSDENIARLGEKIDKLTVTVFEIASNMKSFNSEFKIKTSSWVFLGLVSTILAAVVIYFIKTQLP